MTIEALGDLLRKHSRPNVDLRASIETICQDGWAIVILARCREWGARECIPIDLIEKLPDAIFRETVEVAIKSVVREVYR